MVRLAVTLVTLALASLVSEGSARAGGATLGEAEVGTLHDGACRRGQAVYAGERVVFCGGGVHAVAAEPVWSRGRQAVAFATRSRRGRLILRVAVIGGRYRGTLLSWRLRGWRLPGPLSVMWLGHRRIGLGQSPVRPMLVASWRLRNI